MLYRFDRFLLDTAQFELTRDRQRVEIEPQVLKLLTFLVENRDRVVARFELLEHLSGQRILTDNALSVRIKAVRQAVGDTTTAQAIVKTIPGVGYRFVAGVEVSAYSSVVPGQHPAGDSAGDNSSAASHPSDLDRAISSRPSIAVLPFETIGADASESIIARGLVHDVITRIARSRMMFIIARGTAFQFSSGEHDVRDIGEKLGVRYLAQGAVQIVNKKVRVSVALANTLTREEIWSWQYDRKLDDFMLVQEEIATMIVGALEFEVEQEEVQRSLLMPSTNLDAWSAYHRGVHHMYQFKAAECEKAEYFFRRSIDLEPNVPRPYAGLSFLSFERVFLHLEKDRAKGIQKTHDFAAKSLEVDPMDPMGHWALSRAHMLRVDLEASKNSLDTATELNPSYAIAQYSLGWVALQLGENKFCIDRIDLARRLSPYDPLKFAMMGVTAFSLALMGRTEEALALTPQAMAHPNIHHTALAIASVVYALCGQLDKAQELMKRVRAVMPGYDLDDFLVDNPFRKQSDVRRVSQAFGDIFSH